MNSMRVEKRQYIEILLESFTFEIYFLSLKREFFLKFQIPFIDQNPRCMTVLIYEHLDLKISPGITTSLTKYRLLCTRCSLF